MELDRRIRIQLQFTGIPFYPQLPLYRRLMLGLLFSMMVIVSGAMTFTRQMQPTNPFADFDDLFAEDARQMAVARGFTCGAVSFSSHPRTITDYCELQITHERFSQISLGLLGNAATEIGFSVREHTLMVGDLATLWGKPEFWQNGEIVSATWPTQHVTAIASLPQTGRISYFLPVVYVAFTRSGNPRWALLLMMDKLPMLCNDCRGL